MEEEKSDNRSYLPPGGSVPWLVYTHGNARSRKFQTFCTVSSSPPYTRHYFKSIPQLRDKFIICSNDGWLLLRDYGNIKFFTLWNSISLQLINLPPLNALNDLVVSNALVCPPSEDGNAEDISVFVFVKGTAFIYRPYRDNYTWIARSTELEGQRAYVRSAVTCNDIIYGSVTVRGEIGVSKYFVIIDVSNESNDDARITLRSLESETPDPEFGYTLVPKRLLVSCGRVYCIGLFLRDYADKRISAVNIWEFDSCLTKWVQVKDLMGRAFFLAPHGRTWCWGTTTSDNESEGVKQNSVYFHVSGIKKLGVEDALYLYNLEDCSLKSLLPCPKSASSWYTPCWVMSQYPTNPRAVSTQLARDEEAHKQCIQKIGSLELDNQCVDNRSDISESSSQFSFLSDLPLHTIEIVAQKMHLFDYLNFRSTCKEFRSIAPPMTRWRTNNQYPLLLLFENEEPFCSIMDPCRSDLCYMAMPPELFRGVVHLDVSKDGWLLLRTNEGTSLHYFNPFTRVSRELTPFRRIPGFSVVGFSSCPTSPDCVTVGMSCWTEVEICYHCFEEDTWNVCVFDWEDGVEFRCVLNCPVYHKGAFYFLDFRGYLGVFELVDEDGVWNVYDKPQTPEDYDSFHSRHLVECGEELFSVFIGEMGSWVRVFRFNQRKKKWVGVKSLGNYVLFVGPWSSFSMLAKEPEMENRIYLPRQCGNEILFYDLNTGKYGTLTDEDKDFTDTSEHLRCIWI